MAEAEVRIETEPAGPAELEAKAAEVSAEHAAQAAAAAMTMAAVSAAEVEQNAAEEIAEWQIQLNRHTQETGQILANLTGKLSEIDSREAATATTLAALSEQMQSIQSLLAPPLDEPGSLREAEENAAEPAPGTPGSADNPASTEAIAAVTEPAREPEPTRRRAHRWI